MRNVCPVQVRGKCVEWGREKPYAAQIPQQPKQMSCFMHPGSRPEDWASTRGSTLAHMGQRTRGLDNGVLPARYTPLSVSLISMPYSNGTD